MEKYSIEDALLEASNNNDLTIIGDSSERFKISLLGTLSQRVARHSQKPIVIVKKSRPISKESLIIWLKSLSAKYMQDSGRKKVKTTTDKPSERFWSKINADKSIKRFPSKQPRINRASGFGQNNR
jgi:hypothetical protein